MSIFDNVVRREPGYTQLLVNLMRRDTEFRKAILGKLLNSAVAAEILPHHLHADQGAEDSGRPDITIRRDDLLAFIEVKVRRDCHMTANQYCEDPTDETLSGYIQHLRSTPVQSRWMVFLVPRGYKHTSAVELFLERVSKNLTPRIDTRLVLWEAILPITQGFVGDSILREFHDFLLRDFGPITFTGEEIAMVSSESFGNIFRTIRKLESTIDAVQNTVNESGYNTETERDQATYGFYVKRGKQYLLWFGVWLEVTDREGGNLLFAVQTNTRKVAPEVASRFDEVCSEMHPFTVNTETGAWTVVRVPSEMLSGSNPVEHISKQIVEIAKRLES